MHHLSLSKPSASNQTFLVLGKKYVNNVKPASLFAGFAYASLSGVKRLLMDFSSENWDKINKHFIIGINQGITEPAAIKLLMAQHNIQVRLYIPGKKLTLDSLYAKPLFHPKTMYFEGGNNKLNMIYVSSANLTGAAIGTDPKNYECGQVITFPVNKKSAKQISEFKSWWAQIWGQSRPANEKLLSKYAGTRIKSFYRNLDALSLTEVSADIADAACFWIEVGKASGIERHQLEFPVYLVRYFGKPKKKPQKLKLKNEIDEWLDRPLSYKKTTYKVDIWRLGMPTVNMGGEAIKDRIILFTRTNETGEFEFEVTDAGSVLAGKWAEKCSAYGHLGQTGGAHPRRYGYF